MGNKKIEIPYAFALCGDTECACAGTCLRHIAYLQQVETAKVMTMVNPRFCAKDNTCAFYRDATPVVYARGFTQMQKRMLPEQYDKFLWKLIAHFGRNPYFERRNGKRLLPPSEQELIAEVARQVGMTEEFKFDTYEYRYNWKD